MNVTELRVGNLTSAGIVTEIQKECFYVHDGESSLKNTWFDIKPIPLTEDRLTILNDNDWSFEGFGSRLIYQNRKFKAIKIEQLQNNEWAFYFNDELINFKKYLHEIQNLYFALTQTELKYDYRCLFKECYFRS